MSDKLPMPALDRVPVKAQVRVTTFVKLEQMCEQMNLPSMSAVVNMALDALAEKSKLPFGPEQMARVQEIMQRNQARRQAAKNRKGIK